MRILTIIGARPQFVKAAVVSREMVRVGVEEVIVHTGQHYDEEMSAVFFEELGIPAPVANLGVGSASHAVQTGEIMIGLENFINANEEPDWVLIYGDTNSTIAGALVTAKLNLPLAHVEAGLRSFNRRMPEEINRMVADRLSALLFCPTQTAVDNLAREGITRGVHLTGDVMLDATLLFGEIAARRRPLEQLTELRPGEYFVATVHRAENTDEPARLSAIFQGFGRVGAPVLLPLHPRTRRLLEHVEVPSNVRIMPPQGYLSMLSLVRNARAVLTDSGGLQKEALWLGTPCVTLREETEWVETLERGWNRLAGADAGGIAEAVKESPSPPIPKIGDPGASRRIVEVLLGE